MMKSIYNGITRLFLASILLLAVTMPTWAALEYQETYTSASAGYKVVLVVNAAIYDAIYDSSLRQYIEDLEAEGHSVTLVKFISGTAAELKAYLRTYLPDIKGALFIGDIPYAKFEVAGMIDSPFVCDLYYMNLSGDWLDTNNNGIFDTEAANYSAQIWVGQLRASGISFDCLNMDEVGILRNYFYKNHNYRTERLPIPKRALCFYSLDFASYAYTPLYLSLAYEDCSLTSGGANAYRNKLKEGYEWVHITAHSGGSLSVFGDGASLDFIDILNIDPHTIFYAVDGCWASDYTFTSMGNSYIFAKTYGLTAFGQTKSACLDLSRINDELSKNRRLKLGDALVSSLTLSEPLMETIRHIYRHISYGEVMLGDPTLTIDPPIASMESINLPVVELGERVELNGIGSIEQGQITEYSWRSNRDGLLGSQPNLVTSSLSKGCHMIYFKIKDNLGRWSSEAKTIIAVGETPPDTTAPSAPAITSASRFRTRLQASWSKSQDDESGIVEYEYKIMHKSPSGVESQLIEWTSTKDTLGFVREIPIIKGECFIYVRAKNGAGLYSAEAVSLGIPIPNTIPETVVTGVDNLWHRDPVTVTLSIVDPSAGSFQTYYSIDSTPLTQYTGPFQVSNNGDHAISYYSKNIADYYIHEEIKSCHVKIDTQPPTGSISINNGSRYTASPDVTLNISANDTGVGMGEGSKVIISEPGRTNVIRDYVSGSNIPWTLNSGNGVRTVSIRFQDALGNESGYYTASITLDAMPPAISVVNDGGNFTGCKTSLNAWVSAQDFLSSISGYQYRVVQNSISGPIVKEGADAWQYRWEYLDYLYISGLNLSEGKTYYVGVSAIDGVGNASDFVYSDGIIVDSLAPTTTASGADDLWHNQDVTVTLSAVDAVSGVASTYYLINYAPVLYSDTGPFIINREGENQIGFYSIDNAKNQEPRKTVTVKIDKTPPTGGIVINNGDSSTSSTTLRLALSASDSISGMGVGAKVKLSNDGTHWLEYDYGRTPSSWPGEVNNGNIRVYAQFIDAAGNPSQTYYDDIRYEICGNVTVAVFDAATRRVLRNSILLVITENKERKVIALPNGFDIFRNVPVGKYLAIAYKKGYKYQIRGFSVTENRTTKVFFYLQKIGFTDNPRIPTGQT